MKILFLLLLLLAGIIRMCGQTNTNNNAIPPSTQNPTSGVNVPLIVTTQFNTVYPNTTALWQSDGENFSAEYRDSQTNMGRIIVYDAYGNLVRIETEVDKTIYPDNINLYYTENHPTENYKVWSCDDTHGNLSYYSVRKSGTLMFDKTGNYLRTKPISPSKKLNFKHD